MKIKKILLTATLAGAFCLPVAADDHEGGEDYMLNIMDLTIAHGHGMKFREAMQAYMACYEENGGTGSWSTWGAVDGAPNRMKIVSRMDMWAEMDSEDPGDQACWSEHAEELTSHITNANRQIFRKRSAWSGDAEGYTVVKLHNFRVEDSSKFREVVGEISSIAREAEFEHLGTWYDAIGNQRWGADYFVVEHYENFAAMDEDRQGIHDVLVASVGEEAAEALWDRFDATLADMEPYWTGTWRRIDSLGYSGED